MTLRRHIGSLSVLVCAAVGLVLALAGGDDLAIVGGVLLVIAAAAPMCMRLRVDPLDAVGIYGLVTAAFLGLTSLGWLGSPPDPPPAIDQDDVRSALLLTAAGIAAFALAARLTGRARRVEAVRIRMESAPRLRVLVIAFGLSLIGTTMGVAFGAFGYLSLDTIGSSRLLPASELFRELAALGSLAILAGALVGFATDDSRLLRALYVLVPLQFAAGFLLGTKFEALTPIVYVTLAYVAVRGRIPSRVLIVAAALVVLLIPATRAYRDSEGDENVVKETYEYVGSRLRLIDHVALIQSQTPSIYDYGNGDRYTLLPAMIAVPRAIWSDKPVLEFGQDFSHTYWQLPPNDRTGTGTTQLGDLYRNFKTGGALLGMALWGLVIGGLTAIRRRWRSPRVEMVYIGSLFGWVWILEQDLPTLITTMSRTLPVMVLVAWLLMPGTDSDPGYRRVLAAIGKLRESLTARTRSIAG